LKSPLYLAASLVLGSYLCLATSMAIAADVSSGYGQPRTNGVLQRDPFTTSDKMYGEVGIQSAQKANAQQGFVPGYGAQSVPKMRVKGFVNRGAKRSVALLEIEGAGVYLVSEGEEIGLQALGQNTVIKILKVDANSVKVQSGQVNQVIIVR
jgi:hypothetical protein